jgi:hypothetical protein
MSVQQGNIGIVRDGLLLYYNRAFPRSFRGESTTNLIATYGNGIVNAYPSIGNQWGTYNTNQYGTGAYFSIGTISSVLSNIVTTVSNHPLRTFDVVTPQTTGGGVTAGTNYYVLKISNTQFSLHAYNGTQDGSVSMADILAPILRNTKISINSTSFPTMWWGPPHLPNSGIIKEIIPNGFNFAGRRHDCLRLNWHRPDGIVDGMAYGVQPSYTGSTVYAFSAYVRAVSQSAVGSSIRMDTYHAGPNVGGPSNSSPTLTANWKKWTWTWTSNATPGVYLFYYWPEMGCPAQVDISEMQFEAKGYATSFALPSRSANTVAGGGGLIDLSGNNLNSDLTNATFNTNGYTFSGSQYITVPYSSNLDRNDFTIMGYCRTSTNDNSHDTIVSRNSDVYGATNGWNISRLRNGLSLANCFRFMIYGDSSTAVEPQGPAIADNVWRHFAVVVDKSGTNTVTIYINGLRYSIPATLPNGNFYPSSGSPPLYIGCNRTNADLWNGDIPQILYYERALTPEEILRNFNATRVDYGL